MPIEKSAGAIVFRKKGGKIYYLLLHYPGIRHSETYWDLPKGHIEKGERMEETVKREVREETGLGDAQIFPGFKETIKYFFKWKGKNILKFVTFYLVETKDEKVKISLEHIGYQWLDFERVVEKLSFKNAKEILKKANEHLLKHGTQDKS